MRERDKLFVRALDLTREFVLASKCMQDNLYALAYVMGDGKKYDAATKQAVMPALFQSLNVLTPIISSTFASVERLFEDVPIGQSEKAPFGLLIIDEAGQAVPFAAVGALSRCRRALIVGDPSQIEPVVTSEVKMLRRALGKDIANRYKEDSASVQKLADAVNPYGHNRTDNDDSGKSQWVGCPLVIHRRCISPMFDISNKVSYGGSMINETLPPSEEKAKRFCKESSQWINISGSQVGDKDYYIPKQGEEVAKIVEAAFNNCGGKVPSLFIISPFKTVIAGIKQELGNKIFGCSREEKNRFINSNIGTVHTFQGKEADEVIFVLGCDKRASGVVGFANPNIVNVAVSRAKYRLYIIGDYNVWKENKDVKTAKYELDVAWVSHWEKYQEYKEQGKAAEAQKELKRTAALLPKGSSMPTLDDNGDIAETQFGQGMSEVVWDTESYLENVRGELEGKSLSFADLLSNSDYKVFGFESRADLELKFADYADDEDNLVIDNLEQGMFYYKLLNLTPSEKNDWSSSLILFCCAVEIYMQKSLLPCLKAIAPNESSGKKSQGKNVLLGELTPKQMRSFMLGAYKRILCEKDTQRNLASCYSAGAGLMLNHSISDADPSQKEWWNRFAGVLGKFSEERNSVAHGWSKINADDSKRLLGFLFSSFFSESNLSKSKQLIAIMEQSQVFAAVKRGIDALAFREDGCDAEGFTAKGRLEAEELRNTPKQARVDGTSRAKRNKESDDKAKKAQTGSLTGVEKAICEWDDGNGASGVEKEALFNGKKEAEDAVVFESLGNWDKTITESIRQSLKDVKHEKLKGCWQSRWRTWVFTLLENEGFLERDQSTPKEGRRATPKGLSVGITDAPWMSSGKVEKYNPKFSLEAIRYIEMHIEEWVNNL